jgi:hypothetical protein
MENARFAKTVSTPRDTPAWRFLNIARITTRSVDALAVLTAILKIRQEFAKILIA